MSDSPPTTWQILGHGPAPAWLADYPKIARLHALRRLELPVPKGWFAPPSPLPLTLPSPGAGPWILRSVMPSEDHQDALLTGLSRSVLELRSQEDLRAAEQSCRAQLASLQAQGLFAAPDPNCLGWLLQEQVPTKNLAIAIYDALDQRWFIECYAPQEDPFSGEHTPFFRAYTHEGVDASLCPDQLGKTLAQVLSACPSKPGLEVEVVLDHAGQWHCVQAKPLRVSPSAKYQAFLDAAKTQLLAQGRDLSDYPELELDAEHNPEPLSPAHSWLIDALAKKSQAPGYLVLCGWLYLEKQGPAAKTPRSDATKLDLQALLIKLSTELIPAARASVAAWKRRWQSIERSELVHAIDDAFERCQDILRLREHWVDSFRAQEPLTQARQDFSFSATLSSKAAFADVLPTRWDICAPSLHAASLPKAQDAPQHNRPLPKDPATQWALLEEWDDHLFALALFVMRQAWLGAAACIGITQDLIFFLSKEPLGAFARGELSKNELLAQCRTAAQEDERNRALEAPALLLAGRPARRASLSRWQGLGFGPPVFAELHKRQDLQALLAAPPPASSILAIPALTAPAALALHRLKIRAVVTQYGGVNSHGARMAAELGISAIIGCEACMELPEGESIWLDTRSGRLFRAQDA